jgi:ABC-2 type transport system permease protein
MISLAGKTTAGHYRFADVARMEWIKLRSLRSAWLTLVLTAAGAVGIAVAVGFNTLNRHADLTNNALAGIAPGLLFAGVLGALVMTSEYSSGMIRATFAAIPNRALVLAAKTAVFGAVALLLGEATAFLSFFAGGATVGHGIPAPALDQPGVLRAVLLSGAGFCLIGLLGLGLGAIIRHTAAAIAVVVGGTFVLSIFIGVVWRGAVTYMPVDIVANSLSTTKPLACGAHVGPCVLSAWAGLGMLCLYAAVSLVIGGWLLTRRDA